MRIINPSYEILTELNYQEIIKHIEAIARVCYKSEYKQTNNSAESFIESIIQNKHCAMIEHYSITVKFICDRGISHEIVRHRVASFAQESTRYVNYSNERYGNEITVIAPFFFKEGTEQYDKWLRQMQAAETAYLELIKLGASPQEARSVLPNSTKTEIVVSANIREWRHILGLRTANAAHPQMQESMEPLLKEFKEKLPVLFAGI